MTRLCLGTWAGRDLSTPFEFRGWPFCPKDLISSVALDQNWWGSSPNVRRLHSQAVSYVFSSVAADVAAVGGLFFFFHVKCTADLQEKSGGHGFGGA